MLCPKLYCPHCCHCLVHIDRVIVVVLLILGTIFLPMITLPALVAVLRVTTIVVHPFVDVIIATIPVIVPLVRAFL